MQISKSNGELVAAELRNKEMTGKLHQKNLLEQSWLVFASFYMYITKKHYPEKFQVISVHLFIHCK